MHTDVKYIPQFFARKILCLLFFAKDVEDQFGYGKLNILCHITASCQVLVLNINKGRTTITTTNNIEYFTHDK